MAIASSTPTYAKVASNATTAQVLAAENGFRTGLIIFNASTAVLYVGIGFTPTTSDYSFQIASNGVYEMKAGYTLSQIKGLWATANGNALVTEVSDRSKAY